MSVKITEAIAAARAAAHIGITEEQLTALLRALGHGTEQALVEYRARVAWIAEQSAVVREQIAVLDAVNEDMVIHEDEPPVKGEYF